MCFWWPTCEKVTVRVHIRGIFSHAVLIMTLCAFGPARLMLAAHIHSVSPLWESRVKKREELAQ